MDVHPSGDHLIVGGYDRKLCWFDLELSEKPYKVLKYGLFLSVSSIKMLTGAQVSLSSHSLSALPPKVPAIRVCLGRWFYSGLPLTRLQ